MSIIKRHGGSINHYEIDCPSCGKIAVTKDERYEYNAVKCDVCGAFIDGKFNLYCDRCGTKTENIKE